jgi:hypothetical protein
MNFFQNILFMIILSLLILLPFVFSKNILEYTTVKETLVSGTTPDVAIPPPIQGLITPIANIINNSFDSNGVLKHDSLQPLKQMITSYIDFIGRSGFKKQQLKEILSMITSVSGQLNGSLTK